MYLYKRGTLERRHKMKEGKRIENYIKQMLTKINDVCMEITQLQNI